MIDNLRAFLRRTPIHTVYAFIRYELPDLLVFRVWGSLRLGRISRLRRYFSLRFLHRGTERPHAVAVDIVSVCNLRCPLCSVPPFLTKQDANFMSMEKYKNIIDNIGCFVPDVTLVYAGEPYLHPDFKSMLKYVASDYFVTTISNATLLNSETIEYTVDNLDCIQISFDGHSKESFEKYRVGANFERVKANIKALLEARSRSKSGLPEIAMTFLIHAYNEDEVEESRRYWLSRGVDHFYAKYINLNVHRRDDGKAEENLSHWLPKDRSKSLYQSDDERVSFKERVTPCSTYLSPIIHCSGEVLLCCHDIFNTVQIGNILERPFEEIWNDPEYVRIRKLARERKLPICKICGK